VISRCSLFTVPAAGERAALLATTLCEAFQISAARVPDRIALVDHADHGRALTWSAYAAAVERVAGALATLGVRRGERVAFLARNRPELAIAEAATLHLGAAGVVLYAASPPATIEHVLRDSEPLLLLVESELDGRLAEVRHAVGQTLTLDGASNGCGAFAMIAAPAGFDFEAAWRTVQPDDLVGLVYTSSAGAVALEREDVLQVQKIDSMRWRIGARCSPRPGSSLRWGRTIVASISATASANALPA
jgi:long-chain acyl-CoA synthetase